MKSCSTYRNAADKGTRARNKTEKVCGEEGEGVCGEEERRKVGRNEGQEQERCGAKRFFFLFFG
jgi:hypothetical protein